MKINWQYHMISNALKLMAALLLVGCAKNQAPQNPSPMQEHIRPHARVDGSNCEGEKMRLDDILEGSIDLFIPTTISSNDSVALAIHFHGSSKVVNYAACASESKMILATINLGSGSSKYERPFQRSGSFNELLTHIDAKIADRNVFIEKIYISGFSAGYGAIRAILNDQSSLAHIEGVILLDGLHTSYQPEGMTLYKGGKLNEDKLNPFLKFAQLAVSGEKGMLITHSSIFPGTYASTTECTGYLISTLGLSRTPVLKEGPLGMQQVGETPKGKFIVLAFAGNTAPDHMDHLHGFSHFLNLIMKK